MTFTYTFHDAENTILERTDEKGKVTFVPVSAGNRDYAEFLASGAEAAPYVAPPEPTPLTTEQKLANTGLTVEELKTLLSL